MESLDNASKTSKGFFKYVFNFDEDTKGELLNIIQYAVLSIIPIVLINKFMQKYVPEATEDKGSLEITVEVILQTVVMFISIFFINRIINFIPTYSGVKYPEFSVIFIVLSVLMITLSLQTKLGEKVSILVDRILELWEGKPKENNKKKHKKEGFNGNGGNVTVSQPLSGQRDQMAMEQAMRSNDNTTNIDQLPIMSGQQIPDNSGKNMQQMNNNYNDMNNSMMGGGIMAASEVLGGSFGGSTF